MTIIVSQIVSAIGYAPFSGTLWVAEDNVLQSGKFIKAGIILNSNKWKKVTWFEIEMRWRRWVKSFISYPGRWARGDLWWGGLFQFYNGKDGDLRLLCEVWGAPSTLQKGTSFIKVWLHCPFFFILERMMVWSSLSSFYWTLSFSQVPRQSHVNLSSHLREAQALSVIMTYRRLPMGRGCDTHTHTHACKHAHEQTLVYHLHLCTLS